MNEITKAEPWFLSGWSKHISPSSLGRAAACPRSEAMPHVYSESGEPARRGIVAHKFLSDCLEVGRDAAMSRVENPDDIDWLSMLNLEALPAFRPEAYVSEIAIAYRPSTRTARKLGEGLSREQARALADDGEIVGIIDVLGESDDAAVAHDYKTGRGHIEAAEVNWQLRTYALFAARWLNKTAATYSVIRVWDTGEAWADVAHMDELDLLAHEEKLLDLLHRRAQVRADTIDGAWGNLPALVEGRHCRYCPAMFACPAKTEGIRNIVSSPSDSFLTPESASEAWLKIKHAKRTLERWESIVKEMARQHPLSLPDGEVLGEKEVQRETILPNKARAALERQYGQLGAAVAGECTEVIETMTKTELRKALKSLVLPTLPPAHQKITWLERDVLKLLRESGAVSVKLNKCVTEYTPKTEKPALESGETEKAA